jgi:hypothetical protein
MDFSNTLVSFPVVSITPDNRRYRELGPEGGGLRAIASLSFVVEVLAASELRMEGNATKGN